MTEQTQNTDGPDNPVYGDVSFSSPENRKVIEKWGRRSAIVLQVRVPILGTGLSVDSAIWAEHKRDAEGDSVRFTASLPRGLKAEDDFAKEYFCSHVENSAEQSPVYLTACEATFALLTGAETKMLSKNGRQIAKRPTLVLTPAILKARADAAYKAALDAVKEKAVFDTLDREEAEARAEELARQMDDAANGNG